MKCTSLNKAHGLYPFLNRNLLKSPQYTKVKMNLTHPTIGPYDRFQSSTESSKKMIYNRLKAFLEKFGVLHESQHGHGFREKRSTEHVILEIIKSN